MRLLVLLLPVALLVSCSQIEVLENGGQITIATHKDSKYNEHIGLHTVGEGGSRVYAYPDLNSEFIKNASPGDTYYIDDVVVSGGKEWTDIGIGWVLTSGVDLINESVETPNASEDGVFPNSKYKLNGGRHLSDTELIGLNLLNGHRRSAKVNELAVDLDANKLAKVKADDIVSNDYFDHDSPVFGSPTEMANDHGIYFLAVGENLAKGHLTISNATKDLMDSPGHKENILQEEYTHIGLHYNEEAKIYVQIFLKKS